MQFVLVSLVILPVLPDQTYGPYHVLNPHRIWILVVLWRLDVDAWLFILSRPTLRAASRAARSGPG